MEKGIGLMYVDIKVNGEPIRAMVETGARQNDFANTEVERLGLTLEKGYGRVKAINSVAQPVSGIAKSVLIKVGPYLRRKGPSFPHAGNRHLLMRDRRVLSIFQLWVPIARHIHSQQLPMQRPKV